MTTLDRRNIVLLIHLNRSGSTFLANQVSAHPDVCVCPEAHRPLQRLLARRGRRRSSGEMIERLLSDVRNDPKLSTWGLDPQGLAERLREAADEVDVLYGLLDAYADATNPQATVVMAKGYCFIDLIRRRGFADLARGRECQAILLVRDPRAIFNSQRRSMSSTLRRPMQESAIACALRWRIYMRHVAALAEDPHCRFVKYERWTADNDRQRTELCAFLALRPAVAEKVGPRLQSVIPPGQQHLHRNIDKGPLVERNLAWQQSLPADRIALLQRFSGRMLERHYEIVPDVAVSLTSAAAEIKRWAAGRMSLLR